MPSSQTCSQTRLSIAKNRPRTFFASAISAYTEYRPMIVSGYFVERPGGALIFRLRFPHTEVSSLFSDSFFAQVGLRTVDCVSDRIGRR